MLTNIFVTIHSGVAPRKNESYESSTKCTLHRARKMSNEEVFKLEVNTLKHILSYNNNYPMNVIDKIVTDFIINKQLIRARVTARN